MLSKLVEQVYEHSARGAAIRAAEVGAKTWEYLIDIAAKGSGQYIPPRERKKIKDATFMGIKIRPNDEVPEGKLYPLEE